MAAIRITIPVDRFQKPDGEHYWELARLHAAKALRELADQWENGLGEYVPRFGTPPGLTGDVDEV